MFTTLLTKEFLNNLLSFRFQVSLVICLLLTLLSVVVLRGEYMTRASTHAEDVDSFKREAENRGNYNDLGRHGVGVARPPAKLQVSVYGLERSPDNTAKVGSTGVPRLQHDPNVNPVLAMYPVADLMFIVATVISLLAFVMSYDAVSGERMEGTLKLLMSHSVPRDKVILAKLIGGYLSCITPVVLAIVVGTLVILMGGGVNFTAVDWGAYVLVVAASLLLVAAMFSLGVFVSVIVQNPSTSIISLVVVWVIFVMIVPNVSPYAGAQMSPAVHFSTVLEEVRQDAHNLNKELTDSMREKGRGLPRRGSPGSNQKLKDFFETWKAEKAEINEKISKMEADGMDEFQRQQQKQIDVTKWISRVSPVASYIYTVTDLAGTGLRKERHFFDAVNEYQILFKEYIETRNISGGRGSVEENFTIKDMPLFEYEEEPLAFRLQAVSADISMMSVFVIFFFLASFLAFLRADLL
ncbi:ABC transporter permease subunit [Candidatus Hydrogenedentota bacterium]